MGTNFKFLKGNGTLWVCSNDPEVCGFVTNDIRGGKLSISKCPDCEDGYLIVKPIKDKNGVDTGNRMLGCTNYKADGTGCTFAMFPKNYTQDKSKIAIEFYNSKLTLDNMVVMGYPIKELVLSIIRFIDKITNCRKGFELTFMTFVSFLKGKTSKSIETFKLNEIQGYGFISEKYHNRVIPLLKEMKNLGIIDIAREKYETIKLLNDNPDEVIFKTLFSNIIPKER